MPHIIYSNRDIKYSEENYLLTSIRYSQVTRNISVHVMGVIAVHVWSYCNEQHALNI